MSSELIQLPRHPGLFRNTCIYLLVVDSGRVVDVIVHVVLCEPTKLCICMCAVSLSYMYIFKKHSQQSLDSTCLFRAC